MSRTILHSALAAVLAMPVCGTVAAGAAEFVVTATTVPEMKAVFGQVESRIVVPARARIGGSVTELLVSQGDEVRQGQIVAVISDDKLKLQLDAADARIQSLMSQLDNARTQLDRAQQLRAAGTGTQAGLDQARMQFEVAVNQVAAGKADKAVIEQSAREGAVAAPAAGRVLTVPVTPGSVVMPGEDIARIAPGPYYLRLSLPERHAGEIVQDAQVLVGLRGLAAARDGFATARRGRIVKVYPEIVDGRVTADVEAEGIGDYFVNERTLVSIPVGKRTVLAIPQVAVRTAHGIDYVRIAAGGATIDVAVILGDVLAAEDGVASVEVLTGLRDGDRVLLP